MIVAIHQPQFMSWLGYIDKIDRCDAFVFLDNVQFKKNEYQNRNRIKTASGWQWLTVPVTYRYPERIIDVRIDNRTDWRRKHLMAIRTNYSRAPYFSECYEEITKLYMKEYEYLCDINIESVKMILRLFGIEKEIYRASSMEGLREDPTLRLVDICRYLGADTYLSGAGGRDYLDLSAFEREGIGVIFQDFHHPRYPQLYGEFLPSMSAIDLLFNCGREGLSILRGERDG